MRRCVILVAITAYLEQRNPAAAARMLAMLLDGADSLTSLPDRGTPGRAVGTRELRVHRPYVIVYAMGGDTVRIQRIWHAAQDRG